MTRETIRTRITFTDRVLGSTVRFSIELFLSRHRVKSSLMPLVGSDLPTGLTLVRGGADLTPM